MGMARIYQQVFGDQIAAGPFRGMRYGSRSDSYPLAPKLLGTYELELNPAVEEIIRSGHDLIVDVGASDGYYATGFALRLPQTRIVAFEMDKDAQELLRANAALNGVKDRIEIRGAGDRDSLEAVLAGAKKPFLLFDAEGAEMELLDPVASPSLRKTTILVEVHDCVDRRCGDIVRQHCADSHDIEEIVHQPRTREHLPKGNVLRLLARFKKHGGARWMDEWRPEPMRWFYMKPKAGVAAAL